MTRTALRLIKWQSSTAYVRYQLIQTVKNTGDTWVALSPSSSDFTIFAADGSVTETGSADEAAPKYLAPGATGYVLASGLGDEFKLADLVTAEMDVLFDPVDEPGPEFPASKVKRVAASFGGVGATGLIKNDSTSEINYLTVVAIAFDANQRPLGYAKDILEKVRVGATKAFKTDEFPDTVRNIASIKVFGDPLIF